MSTPRRFPWQYHGETLVLETPEQTRVEYRVAPFGARLAAGLLDNAIIFAIGLAVFLFMLLVGPAGGLFRGYLVAVVVTLWFLVSMFYFVVAELRGDGRTFGKRRLGLRAVLATGQGLTLGAALTRNVARIVDNLPLVWFVPALTRGRRRIGDLLAGTFVIEEQREGPTPRRSWLDTLAPSWRELPERRFASLTAAHDRLSVEDLNLIEYLGDRLRALPTRKARQQAMAQIAQRYLERLRLDADRDAVDNDPERFLQELGLFLRDRFEGAAR